MKQLGAYQYHPGSILLIGIGFNCITGILGVVGVDLPTALFLTFCLLIAMIYAGLQMVINYRFNVQNNVQNIASAAGKGQEE